MALSPYVRKPGPAGIIDHYRAIADATDLPIVVQNAGPPFAVGMPTDLLLRLIAEVPSILYVKEERAPTGHHISTLLAALGDRLLGVFGGMAGLFLMSELTRGATGCMPSAGVPDVLVEVYRAFTAGRKAEARARFDRILPLLNIEMSVQMAVSKEVLRRRGIFTAMKMRDPEFLDLDPGDLAELDAIWPSVEAAFALPAASSAAHNRRKKPL
jgi:4-hydroxy-tetrahydrodipicolinate synthase